MLILSCIISGVLRHRACVGCCTQRWRHQHHGLARVASQYGSHSLCSKWRHRQLLFVSTRDVTCAQLSWACWIVAWRQTWNCGEVVGGEEVGVVERKKFYQVRDHPEQTLSSFIFKPYLNGLLLIAERCWAVWNSSRTTRYYKATSPMTSSMYSLKFAPIWLRFGERRKKHEDRRS